MDKSLNFAVLTVSDRCYAGKTEDRSGPALSEEIQKVFKNSKLSSLEIVPDVRDEIRGALNDLCPKANVVVTTGGTGAAETDVTYEAIQPVLEKELNGLVHLILHEGLKETPFAALSRPLVGVIGKTLVVCLPGSQKGALCGFRAISSVIPHLVDLIRGKVEVVRAHHGEKTATDPLMNKKCSKVVVSTEEQDRVRQSPYPMISMAEVNAKILSEVCSLEPILINSEDGVGYVLAESVTSWESIPPRPTSMKDGYAIAAGAEKNCKIVGECRPGSECSMTIEKNDVVKVSTGSCVPPGTEFVVPVENTIMGTDVDSIVINVMPTAAMSDIRPIGSDMKSGVIVLRKNEILQVPEIGIMAAIGQPTVRVVRKPILAVLSTGDEVQDPWSDMISGKVRDSNKLMLLQMMKSWGYETIDMGIAVDEPDTLYEALMKGFDQADVVVTTGGMSMGQRDILKEILVTDFGATIHFGRIQMKPGKPSGFATLCYKGVKKYWFGLPGNPASAYVTSHLLVYPAARLLSGWTDSPFLHTVQIQLTESVPVDNERVNFVRGIISFKDSAGQVKMTVKPSDNQQSSSLLGCKGTNCLLEIPVATNCLNRNVTVHLLP